MIFYVTLETNTAETVYLDGITFVKNDGSEIFTSWESADLASENGVTTFRAKGIVMNRNDKDDDYANGHLQELVDSIKEFRAENPVTKDDTPVSSATITKLMIYDSNTDQEYLWQKH